MLTRQKILLQFIVQAGGVVTKIQLTKWSFLLSQLSQTSKTRTFYQFVPYKQGPFSFTLYRELDNLKRNGYLYESSNELSLKTDIRFPKLDRELSKEIEFVLATYAGWSNDELINAVYEEYPWFTINAEKETRRMQLRNSASPAIYTVGYEGLQVDGFLNILLSSGIERLIDVRNNPISRRYGFHKSTLSNLCDKLRILYTHLPEVGISPESRISLDSRDAYNDLFDMYERDAIPENRTTIDKIAKMCSERPSVLVCMEKDPDFCHRTVLAKYVGHSANLPVQDLRVMNEEEVCQQQLEFS